MQKHPEIHPRGHEVMAEDPPTGDSQRKETPPGGGAPGAGLGGLVGPEDDWDQEASLAAFVAEVEANRKFGLIDLDDYYDPDDGYDLPDDYCGPDGPAAGRPEPEAAGLPRDMAAGPAAGRPEPDAGLLPRGLDGGRDDGGSDRDGGSGFATGGVWDKALPGPGLAQAADAAAGDLPRAFRTADLRLIHAAICCSRYSLWTCCGVRY